MSSLKPSIQTDVVTVASETSTVDVIGLMHQRQSSYALVLDQQQLVGIFTQADVVSAIARGVRITDCPIADVMTHPVISIPEAEAQDAFQVFHHLQRHRIDHLPVVNAQGQATGMVTLTPALCEQIAYLQQTLGITLNDILNSAIASISCFRMDAQQHYDYIYISPGCKEVFGYTADELMGNPTLWFSRVFPDDVEAVVKPAWNSALMGNRHQKEYRFYHKDGTLRWILANVTSRYDAPSDSWIVTSVDHDITYQKQTSVALHESEARFRAIFEQSAIGIAQTTLTGQFVQVNQRFCDIVGYSETELAQLHLSNILHPDDLNAVMQKRQQLFHQEISSLSLEKRYIRKDGEIYWGRLTASLVYDDAGNPQYCVGIIEDIQQQKVAEEMLRYQTEQLQLALDFTGIGLWDWHVQTRQLHWNENSARLLGLPLSTLTVDVETWGNSIHPEDRDRAWQAAQSALQERSLYEVEYRVIWPDGTIRWVLSRGQGIYDESGQAVRMVGCGIDITDHTQTEAALAESEAKFRQLVDNIREVFWMTNADGTEVLYISPSFATIWGMPISHLYQHPTAWMDAVLPCDRPRVEALWARLPNASFEMEYQIERPDGTRRWVRDQGSAIYDEQGHLYRLGGIIEDITERKQTEAALRNSEARFRAIFEQVAVGISEIALSGHYLKVNQGYCETLGYSEADLLALTFQDVTYAGDLEMIVTALRQLLSGEHQYVSLEKRSIRKNGQVRWTTVSVSLVCNDLGTPQHFLCVMQDIHDRKETEAALRESEERFREIANTIRQFFFIRSATTDEFFYLSPAYEQLWGRSCESLYSNPQSWLDNIHPEDRALVSTSLQQQFEGRSVRREYRIIRPDGETRWIAADISVICDESGCPVRFVGFAEDLTDRKQAEVALRESEERFREIAETIDEVFFIEPPDVSGTLYVSPAIEKIFGCSAASLYESPKSWLEYVHPDDRDRVLATLEQQLQGQPTQKEFRIIATDGSLRWIFSRTFPVYSDTGQLLRHIGLAEDITVRKQTEAALRESEERFREIAETVNDVFLINSPDTSQVLYCNPAYATIWGRSLEELYRDARSWLEAVHPDDRDWVLEAFLTQAQGLPYQAEYRILRPDSSLRWVLDRTFPVFDSAGQLLRHVGIITDITEHKQAESALRESEERFRQIAENINEVFFIESHDISETLYISPAFERDWGLNRDSLHGCIGPSAVQVHPDDHALVAEALQRQRQGEPTNKEYRIIHADGSIRWIFARTFPIYDEAGTLLRHVGIAEDTTVRKQTEEALRQQTELLQTILDHVPAMINFFDHDGKTMWVNREWQTILGWTLEEARQRDLLINFFPDPEERRQVFHAIQTANRQWTESRIHTRHGTVIDTAWANVRLSDGRIIGIGQDISDRKQAEAQIRASLKEKESLLQEIHHRVKNNLQVISSLLKLQANRVDDAQARQALEDSWSRVDSMALVHESLYRSENLSNINFEEYIYTLTINLFHIYDVQFQDITVMVEVGADAVLDLDQAVPCGLIVNELISNALKHGFKNTHKGHICVSFCKNDHNQLVLSVANSGDDLPPDFDPTTSHTMGMKLVMSLVNQLEGLLRVERGDFTVFRIVFDSK